MARTMQEKFRIKSETHAKAVSEEGFQLAEVGAGVCLDIAALNKKLEIKANKSKEKLKEKRRNKKGRKMRMTLILPTNKTRKTQVLP